jgi:catechol 2,3-dioxygenase-like lactoylglutathione lyase family enzyme
MPMIDHVSLGVCDLDVSAAFYEAALAALGYRRLVESGSRVAFGKRYPEVWLNARPHMPQVAEDTGSHVCLRAQSMEVVDAFHARALLCGGRDDGRPGMREATMVTYYAAFVRDPDGHRIEVMTVPR